MKVLCYDLGFVFQVPVFVFSFSHSYFWRPQRRLVGSFMSVRLYFFSPGGLGCEGSVL